MPILFEQPDAVSQFASAYAGHGAADQANLDRQFQLQQAALQNQASQANANRIAQAQQAQNQAGLAAGQQQLQSYALGQQGAVTPAMNFQAQQQQALQAQHAQAQMALQAQSFTMADQLQKQRLQAALSDTQQKVASGEYSQDEGNEVIARLQGRLGPLTLREQQARTAKLKEQADLEQSKQAQIDLITGQRAGHLTKEGVDAQQLVYDPETDSLVSQAWSDKNGHNVPVKGTSARAAAQPHEDYEKHWAEAVKATQEHDENGKPKPADPEKVKAHIQAMMQAKQEAIEASKPPIFRIKQNEFYQKMYPLVPDPVTGKPTLPPNTPPEVIKTIQRNNRALGFPEPETKTDTGYKSPVDIPEGPPGNAGRLGTGVIGNTEYYVEEDENGNLVQRSRPARKSRAAQDFEAATQGISGFFRGIGAANAGEQ
jgi:hypothetical protein